MNIQVKRFISLQVQERQNILTGIHALIIEQDKSVDPVIEPMMGKEMIVYKDRGMMKYALASVKNYMSLHVLPMYGAAALYSKYQSLLPNASFQKGCINFEKAEQMPLDIVKQLIADCSSIDLVKIREDYLKTKNKSKK